mgnify:CR=1 FL=1
MKTDADAVHVIVNTVAAVQNDATAKTEQPGVVLHNVVFYPGGATKHTEAEYCTCDQCGNTWKAKG